MTFSKNQIEYLKQLGLTFDFVNMTDEQATQLEDVVAKKLQTSGFDSLDLLTSDGIMCESILDMLA